MARTTVGVLRGGTSSEYDFSLKTGARILSELPEERYETRDIFIDKTGVWHARGIPMDPARALSQVDVVVNALHGGSGEDGTVQRILERFAMPYVGSRPIPSALSLNKARSREVLRKAGIPMPQGLSFQVNDPRTTGQMAQEVFLRFAPPYVVKPWSEGSSYGIKIAETILDLPDAIGDVLDAYGGAVVEEYLLGDEAAAFVIQGYRREDLYVFPPVHIMLPQGEGWLKPHIHEKGLAKHLAPSNFTHEDKQAIADMARAVHRLLDLSHSSVVGIILTSRGPFVIEVDSVPHLHPHSPVIPALESVGSSVREYLEHAIQLGREGR